ncbi:MAG: 30S ribosomal protein S11 [Patescibacteria group bacterium]|nr:MAG: 30S ribosomal protein S11 [Patescibacteria group bacterium]
MGKKRIVKKGADIGREGVPRSLSRVPRKNVGEGILHVQSTYNNTKLLLTDRSGDALAWSSSGVLGFRGAKKGTPFAAAKVGEFIGEKAGLMGIKEAEVVVKGVGPGRESAIRGFASRGTSLTSIKDETPMPHNGPRPKKPRRV